MKRSDERSASGGAREDGSSSASATAAAAAAATHLSALQLLHMSSQLASWIHADAHAHLPHSLQYGPVLLLQTAAANADSPHISLRLLDDTLVLLTYGVSYLELHGDRMHVLQRIEQERAQRTVDRAHLHAHALRIQSQLRCQRFCTHSLAPLELATSELLIPEVQDMMRLGSPTSKDLTTAPVVVDETELEAQIDKYASELQARVEARRRDAELQRQRQQREHREREDQMKKQLYQKRRRHENACRRWNYFTGRLLRLHRDENQQEIQSRVDARRQTIVQAPNASEAALHPHSMRRGMGTSSRQVVSITPSARQLAKRRSKSALRRTASSLLMKNAHSRNFIRQFVAKTIARGLSRVLCASNMHAAPRDSTISASGSSASAHEQPSCATETKLVLRIGILLCDVHFGSKYMGLYQRFLERAAREQGRVRAIEWQLFDCVKSQFPTRALQRVLHGFLVAGGPNTGTNHTTPHHTHGHRRSDTSDSVDSDDNSSHSGSRASALASPSSKQSTAGPWRKNLQRVLRQIYNDKRAVLCGLGLGHVVLAEALGAKCGREEWEDGWSVLDPKLFDAALVAAKVSKRHSSNQQHPDEDASEAHQLKSKYVGIKYLHGEFVRSMDLAPRSMKVWRSLDQRFVSAFKDRWALSFDGFPECGTFVFETMSELYDREKQSHAAAASTVERGERPRHERQRMALKRDSIPETSTFEELTLARAPVRRTGVVDTRLTLDEKKKLLDVADISQVVAHALIDHFATPMPGSAPPASDSAVSAADTINIAAAVNPVQCTNIEESIRAAAVAVAHRTDGNNRVTSILLRVRSTLDGHLVVLGAQLDAFVRSHERRVHEGRRPSLTHGNSAVLMRKNSRHTDDDSPSLLLSLHTLRDQKLVLLDDAQSLAAPSSSVRSERRASRSSFASEASVLSPRQRAVLNVPIQLPTLSASSSVAATPAVDQSVLEPINASASVAADAGASSNRKRPLPSVKRVRSLAMGVLTLSEALTRFQTELTAALVRTATATTTNVVERKPQHVSLLQTPRARVILEFADEESCGSAAHPFQLQRRSPEELRLLLLRLVAALRVSEVPDDCVCILSCQTSVLAFFRRRQPLWTFMKDCRRFAVLSPRHHVRRVSWYARYADALLFDQEMLLSHSAKENEALVQQARYHGLQVFVAREDKAPVDSNSSSSNNNNNKSSVSGKTAGDTTPRSKHRASTQSLSMHRQSTFSGAGILAKAAADEERAMEKDVQVVEILLLALTGIDGVVTPTPEIVLEAAEKLLSKSPIMGQVEQLFRTWQAKGSGKPLQKRPSLRSGSAGNVNDQLDADNEDYMGGADAHDSDDAALVLDESEISVEMARQYNEHGVRRPPSSSYVPLRPLQPKRGDQVLGAATHKQHDALDACSGRFSSADAASRSRLRSIGTFRSVNQHTRVVQTPPHLEGMTVQRPIAGIVVTSGSSDDHVVTRAPEAVLSHPSGHGLLVRPSPSPRTKRVRGVQSQR